MSGGSSVTYRISICVHAKGLYDGTMSEITAAPLMHEYRNYCHLCLHIFPLINVTQMLCLPIENADHLHDFLYMVQI